MKSVNAHHSSACKVWYERGTDLWRVLCGMWRRETWIFPLTFFGTTHSEPLHFPSWPLHPEAGPGAAAGGEVPEAR